MTENDAYETRRIAVGYHEDITRKKTSGTQRRIHAENAESYGQYLFGPGHRDPAEYDLWKDQEDADRPLAWHEYTSERLAVRLLSRGILGAGLYTAANRLIPGQLYGYSRDMKWSELEGKPLRYVAKFFDTVYGKPITQLAKLVAPAERRAEAIENATWFRSQDYFGHPTGKSGRSLGHEITAMTFDFAAGSIGDAAGREIANAVDPRNPNDWYDRDGHFSAGKFTKSLGKSAWKIITKNQGEDWAAGLPYVYQMRYQRQALNKLFPGFKLSSDRGLNGGSWRVDKQGRIIDSYAKAGALDLQLRFTGYNWYTLMYRDLYDAIGHAFKTLNPTDLLVNTREFEEHPLESVIDGIGSSFRYAAKSAIKAFIYMTPAVPFFWATRTPQNKAIGIGVHVGEREQNMYMIKQPNGKSFKAADHTMRPGERVYMNCHPFSATMHDGMAGDAVVANRRWLSDSPFGYGFEPYASQHTRGVLDRALNPLGEMCYRSGNWLHRTAQHYNIPLSKEAARVYANAAYSYTPYMIAKAETALRWNNLIMDKAIYRFLDGVYSMNIKEIKGGLQDINDVIIHPPTNQTTAMAEQMKRQEIEAHKEALRIKHGKATEEKNTGMPDTPVTQVSDVQKDKELSSDVPDKGQQVATWADKTVPGNMSMDNEVPPGVTFH